MTSEWIAAPVCCALVGVALLVHRRVRAFLPEDPPSPRKLQARPLPMVGWLLGVTLLGFALLVTALAHSQGLGKVADWCLCGAIALIVAIGYADDRTKLRGGMPWWIKALGILLACALLLASAEIWPWPPEALAGTRAAADLNRPAWTWLAWLALLFVITNAVNFLDNTDGVAAVVTGVPLLLASERDELGVLAIIGWGLLGFLWWNWPRAKVILGDGGALLCGLLLGMAVLHCLGKEAMLSAPSLTTTLSLCAVPLLDFVQVVLARLWLGYAPWIADRRHLTHILMNLGVSRALIAPLFALAAATAYWLFRRNHA